MPQPPSLVRDEKHVRLSRRAVGGGGRKKKSGDARERREEEGLTLTPSVFLFSRLLAAVEREQDDGDRENGEEKKNQWTTTGIRTQKQEMHRFYGANQCAK